MLILKDVNKNTPGTVFKYKVMGARDRVEDKAPYLRYLGDVEEREPKRR